jgi:DNA-binding response OmpR family regulator
MAKVLVLEPDPDLRALTAESLVEIGHEAVLPRDAGSGAEIDLVMLACASTRGAPRQTIGERWVALPLVCVGDEPVAVEDRCRVSAAYLVRPYSLEVLSAALDRALLRPAARW